MNNNSNPKETCNNHNKDWIPLSNSLSFLLSSKSLLFWSSLLVLVTVICTYFGFKIGLYYINTLTGNFFFDPPETITILGWVKYGGWYVSKILFALASHIVSFYIAFLLAFTMTTPGYVFLSSATEKKQLGKHAYSEKITIKTIFRDLFEGVKIGAFGILVTLAALVVSFVPLIGHATVLLLYTFYSALMFLDYPTSQRGWSLGKKLDWLNSNKKSAIRIGILPALVSMIPILNIFLIALLFPLLTVHTTLNFNTLHKAPERPLPANPV